MRQTLQSECIAGVSVVIPTLNEAESLPLILPLLSDTLSELDLPREIIIVDDDSSDGTQETVQSLSRTVATQLRLLQRHGQRSLSTSVMEGFTEAKYSTLLVIDADLSHEPKWAPSLVGPILSGEADLVVASRYRDGGEITRWPAHRRFVSRVGTFLARCFTRVRDPLSGYFALRRSVFGAFAAELEPRGYKILLEILTRCGPLRVLEVPIRFQDREMGKSKFGIRQQLEFLQQLLHLGVSRLGRPGRDRLPPRRGRARIHSSPKKVMRSPSDA